MVSCRRSLTPFPPTRLAATLLSSGRFDLAKAFNQQLVELNPIDAMVSATMTIGTYPDYVRRAVGATVRKPVNMVAFDVPSAIRPFERPFASAMLTVPGCTCQYVITNVSAPGKYGSIGGHSFRRRLSCSKSTHAEIFQIGFCIRSNRFDPVELISHIVHSAKLENDRIAHVAVTIGSPLIMMAFVDHFSHVSQTAGDGIEEMDGLSRFPGFYNRAVANGHDHVTALALTEIFKHSVLSPSVCVTVLMTLVPTDDKNHRHAGWRDDPVSLLATVDAVNVRGAVVDLSYVERHLVPHFSLTSLLGCRSSLFVKGAV